MRYTNLAVALFCFFIFSCSSFALSINSYIYPSVTMRNMSTQAVIVTSTASPLFQNYLLPPSWQAGSIFTPDQLTVASGQLFSQSVSVVSAADHTPICTVTSLINFSLTSETSDDIRPKLTNDNELRCYTARTQSGVFGSSAEYSFSIAVYD